MKDEESDGVDETLAWRRQDIL